MLEAIPEIMKVSMVSHAWLVTRRLTRSADGLGDAHPNELNEENVEEGCRVLGEKGIHASTL